ncbi:MAG: hypothetical protein IJ769_00410 [Clostridia bacterium]|nr:hypothetical protein [Clostridia bacterium]
MIDWNRDGRVDAAEVALTLYMISQEESEEPECAEEGQPSSDENDPFAESDGGEWQASPHRRRKFGRM